MIVLFSGSSRPENHHIILNFNTLLHHLIVVNLGSIREFVVITDIIGKILHTASLLLSELMKSDFSEVLQIITVFGP